MRRTSIMALAAAIVAVSVPTSGDAEAAGGDRSGGDRVRAVTYGADRGDPYAYRHEPRGYYPYYGSPYWRPAREMLLYRDRYHHELPHYYAAWGYPRPTDDVSRALRANSRSP